MDCMTSGKHYLKEGLKRSIYSNNSIVSESILLFLENVYLEDSRNKICISSSSQWFNIVQSRLERYSKSFILLCSVNNRQCSSTLHNKVGVSYGAFPKTCHSWQHKL